MRFISKWSYACAKGIAETLNEDHKKRSTYYFGFQILLGDIIKFGIMFIITLLLGIFVPSLIVYFSFVGLRKEAGGYHMNSQGKCLYVSLGLLISATLIAKYTYPYWGIIQIAILITITFLLGLYVLIKYAPKDTPNKPIIDPVEIRKGKIWSLVYLFVWLIITVVLTVMGYYLFAICMGFGVLLELFVITPIGHKFFDLINYGFKS